MGEGSEVYDVLLVFVDAEGEGRHTVSMYSPLGAAFRAAGRDILTNDTLLFSPIRSSSRS